MVDPVAPISASAASAAIKTESSLSVAEPDNAWTDARQSVINAHLAELKDHPHEPTESEEQDKAEQNSLDDRHPHRRQEAVASDEAEASEEQSEDCKLSGESERIGSRNFDDETPFGHRVLII